MTVFRNFEEIVAWQKARVLVNRLYNVSTKEKFWKDFVLRDQMRKAALSVFSNIAEGFERNGNREFAQFLSIAKGSAGELRAQLYIALDLGYIDAAEFHELSELTLEIGRMLSALMRHLSTSSFKGVKYK